MYRGRNMLAQCTVITQNALTHDTSWYQSLSPTHLVVSFPLPAYVVEATNDQHHAYATTHEPTPAPHDEGRSGPGFHAIYYCRHLSVKQNIPDAVTRTGNKGRQPASQQPDMSSSSPPTPLSRSTSFYSAVEGDVSTAASSPVQTRPCPYRSTKPLPRELKDHVQIFLEEQLCTPLRELSTSTVSALVTNSPSSQTHVLCSF